MKNISFTNPQWRKRKLRRFLYLTFSNKLPPEDNEELQFFLLSQTLIERRLKNLLINGNDEEGKKIFTPRILGKESYQKFKARMLNDINQNNIESYLEYEKRIATPLLQTYASKSKNGAREAKVYCNAVASLLYKFTGHEYDFSGINFKVVLDKVHKNFYSLNNQIKDKDNFYIANIGGKRCEVPSVIDNKITNPPNSCFCLQKFCNQNPKAPIFIINSIQMAYELQKKYIIKYKLKLQRETLRNLEKLGLKGKSVVNVIKSLKKGALDFDLHPYESQLNWMSLYGGYKALEYTEEKIFKNKEIYWVYYQKGETNEFIEKFVHIYAYLHSMSYKDLQFIFIPDIKDTVTPSRNDIHIWSPQELLEEAFEQKIKIPEELNGELAKILAKKKTDSPEEYLIYPSIRKNSLMVLTAPKKHGKSFFAMTLAFASATKGKLFANWRVKQRAKVLYIIDREVDQIERDKRVEIFKRLYRAKKMDKSVTFEPVSNINLLDENCQKMIEQMLNDAQLGSAPRGEPVKLIVFDHLTKMTRGNLSSKNWDNLRPWLKKLMENYKLSILLLHHSNKQGEVYGSSFIVNDANIHINLSKKRSQLKINQFKNLPALEMGITIPDNRHGYEFFEPLWVKLDTGKNPSLSSDLDQIFADSIWKSLDKEGRVKKFIELKIDNPKIKIREIAEIFGIGLKSVEALAVSNKLTNGGWKSHPLAQKTTT